MESHVCWLFEGWNLQFVARGQLLWTSTKANRVSSGAQRSKLNLWLIDMESHHVSPIYG